MTSPSKHIVIVGDDLHAFSVAVGLMSGLRNQQVQISVVGRSAQISAGALSLDIVAHRFHRELGIQEPILVKHLGGVYCYGVSYQGFGAAPESFVYTNSPTGHMVNRVPFHDYVNRLRLLGIEVNFADYSIACQAAHKGCFTHPQPDSPLEQLDYTMQVDRQRYWHFLRSAAMDNKVELIEASVDRVVRDVEDGRVTQLELSNGAHLDCDFVFDCVGNLRAEVNNSLDASWADSLPFSRRLYWSNKSASDTPVLDYCVRVDGGFIRSTTLSGIEHHEFLYDETVLDEASANGYLESHFKPSQMLGVQSSKFTPGVRRAPWSGNVVAVGAAAGCVTSLFFGELFHTHTAIERWLVLYPRADSECLLAGEYNRQAKMEYAHVRDVNNLLLHDNIEQIPETLAHRLELFRKTGRVAFYESDVLEKHQWVNLLIGCGVLPQRTDPLLNPLSKSALEHLLSDIRKQAQTLVGKFPKHDQLLNAIRQSA